MFDIINKTIIPLVSKSDEQVNDEINKLLEFCKVSRTRNEMQEFLKLHHREHFITKFLNPLKKVDY